ncbi:MAG TPA: STAS domain-containing protein [Roseiflexaceae bacterium]|nr:STAS domain-containing protein [Roseiflexaceae bacterium]
MLQALRRWLDDLPYSDLLQRRQAGLLQYLLLSLMGIALIDALSTVLTTTEVQLAIVFSATVLVFELLAAGALVLLRRGHLRTASLVLVTTILVVLSALLILTGLENNYLSLMAFVIPVCLAGFLFGRRGLWVTTAASFAVVGAVAILESIDSPLVGFIGSDTSLGYALVIFVFVLVLLSLFLDRFGGGFREALAAAAAREQELEHLRQSLEETVAERTARMEQALRDTEARSEEQGRLLMELEQQRAVVREMSVPVIPVSETILVIPLVGALDTGRLRDLQSQALRSVERTSAHYLVLDITGVSVVDTQVAQGIMAVVEALRLLGAVAILVGIRPEIAQTIVGLGLHLRGLQTYSDLRLALGAIAGQNGSHA